MSEVGRTSGRWAAIGALLALFAAGEAAAQLYKCKGPNGKIVYSDQRCESTDTAGKLAPGVANRARENEEKAAADKAAAEQEAEKRRLDAEARVAAERKYDAEAAGRKASPQSPGTPPPEAASVSRSAGSSAGAYTPTSAERERLRDLETTAGSAGAYSEQKTAAQLHANSIRRGHEARLSAADRERRDALTVDLTSADAKRRQQALRELRSIYSP